MRLLFTFSFVEVVSFVKKKLNMLKSWNWNKKCNSFKIKCYIRKHLQKITWFFLVPSSRFQHFKYIIQDPKPQETEKIRAVVSFFNRNLKLHGPFRSSDLQICCKFSFVTILFFFILLKFVFFALILKLKFYGVPVQWFLNPIVPWKI